MNHIVLQGILQSVPELRFSQDGLPRTSALMIFPAAKPEEPEHTIRIVVFGNHAEEVHQSIHQGDSVLVEGRLQIDAHLRPDGSKERSIELIARRVHGVGLREHKAAHAATPQEAAPTVVAAARARRRPPTSRPAMAAMGESDEMPF